MRKRDYHVGAVSTVATTVGGYHVFDTREGAEEFKEFLDLEKGPIWCVFPVIVWGTCLPFVWDCYIGVAAEFCILA